MKNGVYGGGIYHGNTEHVNLSSTLKNYIIVTMHHKNINLALNQSQVLVVLMT